MGIRGTGLLINVALSLISAALSLAVAEIALRIAGFPSNGLRSVSAQEFASIPGPWSPGQSFLCRENPQLPYRVHTNSLGLRGPETTLTPDRPRVLFVGDSFTFGDYVDDEETLPAQVQARLGTHIEVLNGGVGGSTITDQRVFLERLLVLQPTLVVLVFFENDLNDLFLDPPLHEQLAKNRALKSGPLRPLFFLIRDTALFQTALRAQREVRNFLESEAQARKIVPFYSDAWVADRAQSYAQEVIALNQRLERDDIDLILTGFPHPFSVRDSDPDLGNPIPDQISAVSHALHAIGFSMIDLRPALQVSGRSLRELYLFPHDGHASPLGYSIAADTLTPHIRTALDAMKN
jgi:hypothetical protein